MLNRLRRAYAEFHRDLPPGHERRTLSPDEVSVILRRRHNAEVDRRKEHAKGGQIYSLRLATEWEYRDGPIDDDGYALPPEEATKREPKAVTPAALGCGKGQRLTMGKFEGTPWCECEECAYAEPSQRAPAFHDDGCMCLHCWTAEDQAEWEATALELRDDRKPISPDRAERLARAAYVDAWVRELRREGADHC